VKVHHRYKQHWLQIPVLLVLLISLFATNMSTMAAANLQPVSMTPLENNGNNIRLLTSYSELEGKSLSIC
jgi:hypothetical protein